MNIKNISKEIENIKYPAIFLFRLNSFKYELGDDILCIILRLFLKHHSLFALENNMKELFNELVDFSKSWECLSDFYKLLKKKMSLVFAFRKWQSIFVDKIFWKLPYNMMATHLINIKERFHAIYDCSKGGFPFHYKLGQLFKSKVNNSKAVNQDIINNIAERLESIVQIFGIRLLSSLGIPLITKEDLEDLNMEGIIKYLLIIFEKIKEILEQTIKLFNSYEMTCNIIEAMINPVIININTTNCDLNIMKEDICLFCEKF